jgi:hypothetical protein
MKRLPCFACVTALVTVVGCSGQTLFRETFDQEPCVLHVKSLVSGFTITSGDVNVVGGNCPDTNFVFPTRAIDLDGAGPPTVTESNRVFDPGEYEIRFSLAGHPFRPGSVLVEFGTLSKSYRRSTHQPFQLEREHAVVSQPSKLRFTFSGSSDDGGPTLDDIEIVRMS